MSPKTDKKQAWAVASYVLDDAYTDFILSGQAIGCTPGTLRFYNFTAGKFVEWLKNNGVNSPGGIAPRHIRTGINIIVFFPMVEKSSRGGRWYMAHRPFHDANNPSFWIDTKRGICGFFSCGFKLLDVINLYARLYGLSNSEAILVLSEKTS